MVSRLRLPHHPRGAQLGDCGGVVPGLAQNRIAVLADAGRQARRHFRGARNLQRAVEGHEGFARERDQHPGLPHLTVGGNIVHHRDHAEDQPGGVEDRPPVGQILAGEHLVQHPDQRARIGMPVLERGKARIAGERRPADALDERRPLLCLVEQGEDQPAAVLAAVVVGERVGA